MVTWANPYKAREQIFVICGWLGKVRHNGDHGRPVIRSDLPHVQIGNAIVCNRLDGLFYGRCGLPINITVQKDQTGVPQEGPQPIS